MKYLYLTLMVSLHTTLTVTAQKMSFQTAVGIGGTGGYHHRALAFSYEPRFNFYEFSKQESLSIGVMMSMGPSINDDYRTYRPQVHSMEIVDIPRMVSFPVTVNYTFGNAATPDSRRYMGYSAGIGYGYLNARRKTDPVHGSDSTALQAHGLVLRRQHQFSGWQFFLEPALILYV